MSWRVAAASAVGVVAGARAPSLEDIWVYVRHASGEVLPARAGFRVGCALARLGLWTPAMMRGGAVLAGHALELVRLLAAAPYARDVAYDDAVLRWALDWAERGDPNERASALVALVALASCASNGEWALDAAPIVLDCLRAVDFPPPFPIVRIERSDVRAAVTS